MLALPLTSAEPESSSLSPLIISYILISDRNRRVGRSFFLPWTDRNRIAFVISMFSLVASLFVTGACCVLDRSRESCPELSICHACMHAPLISALVIGFRISPFFKLAVCSCLLFQHSTVAIGLLVVSTPNCPFC